MRFSPHKNVSFQFSLHKIDDDYDSGYSSDESADLQLELNSNGELVYISSPTTVQKVPCSSTDVVAATSTSSTLEDILQDVEIHQRYSLVSEVASLKSLPSPVTTTEHQFKELLDKFDKLTLQAIDLQLQSTLKSRLEQGNLMQSIACQDELLILARLELELAKYNDDVSKIVAQFEEQRRLKLEAELKRIREEEERKKKEEELRILKLELERKLKLELEKKLKEEEERKKAELAREKAELEKRKLLEAKLEQERKLEEEKLKLEKLLEEEKLLKLSKFTHNELRIQKEFLKYKQDIADIKSNVVEPLLAQKELKQVTNKVRRKINPKFGQLTNSVRKLTEISNDIVSFLRELKLFNDLSYKYLLNFVAKELVKQAEVEVIVSPDHSVPLAMLLSNILGLIPDLAYYLKARFYKKCPYLLGYTCAIDTEEGRVRMGWRKPNGKWEEESKYNERVGGILTLYFVLCRLGLGPDGTTPFPISETWMFVARMMNLKPELLLDTHFILVANWWDACIMQFMDTYKEQAQKMVMTISQKWLPLVENRKFSGYVRLRLLIEDWQKGVMPRFKDMEM